MFLSFLLSLVSGASSRTEFIVSGGNLVQSLILKVLGLRGWTGRKLGNGVHTISGLAGTMNDFRRVDSLGNNARK